MKMTTTRVGHGHPPNADHPKKSKKSGGNWIAGAIRHPGALHEQLGVPKGQKIPQAKLESAENSDNPTLARRARLAETFKGFRK
jgi:hypothetical protein